MYLQLSLNWRGHRFASRAKTPRATRRKDPRVMRVWKVHTRYLVLCTQMHTCSSTCIGHMHTTHNHTMTAYISIDTYFNLTMAFKMPARRSQERKRSPRAPAERSKEEGSSCCGACFPRCECYHHPCTCQSPRKTCSR